MASRGVGSLITAVALPTALFVVLVARHGPPLSNQQFRLTSVQVNHVTDLICGRVDAVQFVRERHSPWHLLT